MQNLQRDHGVAGRTHWLLDEGLSQRRPVRVTRPLPVLLRHEAVVEPAGDRFTEPPRAPSVDAFLVALGLLAALSIYLLLRAGDVGGALQGVPGESDEGSMVVMTTPVAQPEVAALRALLGAVPPSRDRGDGRSERSATKPQQEAPKPPATDKPLLPLVPPAPLPAPDPSSLPEALRPAKTIEDLERAAGLEPATLKP